MNCLIKSPDNSIKIFRSLVLHVFFFAAIFTHAFADKVLNIFDYDTTSAARSAWKPASGVSQVGIFEGDGALLKRGVRFPCNFKDVASRCYWDTLLKDNFSSESMIRMRVFIDNPDPVSNITLYIKSGNGWFYNSFSGLIKGWQTLSASKENFLPSGTPTGWDTIDGVRFSPWKILDTNVEIIANRFVAETVKICVVKGTKSSSQTTASNTANIITERLKALNLEYRVVTEEDVEAGILSGARLAIFPYSNNMSSAEIAEIEKFISGGGKIIVFFTAPAAIMSKLGIQNLGLMSASLSAMRFVPGGLDCAPDIVGQASWNFYKVKPISPDARTIAYWEDTSGTLYSYPAWTLCANGAYMSHIILGDDLENKNILMLALVAHFMPEVAQGFISDGLADLGKIGAYTNFGEAVDGIRAAAKSTPRLSLVEERLSSATLLRTNIVESESSDTFCISLAKLAEAKTHILEAYYLAQKSRLPEMRGVWASYYSDSGPYAEGWGAAAEKLRQYGFNAVFPFFATGGVAYYDSAFLPHYEDFPSFGDQIKTCIEACKPKGIGMHVRKLNWFLYHAPKSFIDEMRTQKRTQVDVNGNSVDWLCPSNPLNRELEKNVMLEIINNYDIDGIHYDFIRYPDESCCYCDGCRERFQGDTGITVAFWPLDCFSGVYKDTYRNWRCDQITRLVREMKEAVGKSKKNIKISAAVFPSYPSCKTVVAQDWAMWIEKGYLDFVCPMDYTNSASAFRSYVERQTGYVNGKIPLCPGVGLSSGASQLSPDGVIAQILIARELGAAGFVIFSYSDYFTDTILPILRKGVTADPDKSAFIIH